MIYQDNQSAILLERNEKKSSEKGTRHIDIRYYFITDQIQQQQVRVEYCPTKEMNADPFTKPLQGSLFRKFRNRMLNLDEETAIKINGKYHNPTARATFTGDRWWVENRYNDRLEVAVADDDDTPQECVESVDAKIHLHAGDKAGVTSPTSTTSVNLVSPTGDTKYRNNE